MKNEKVAKGRIIGLAGPCLTSYTELELEFHYLVRNAQNYHILVCLPTRPPFRHPAHPCFHSAIGTSQGGLLK